MTDEIQSAYQIKSDEWRANGHRLQHSEEAQLNTAQRKLEIAQAQAEMRHLLGSDVRDADKRMTAATIATIGRPIDSRTLADSMLEQEKSQKAAMFAAAASLSGIGR